MLESTTANKNIAHLLREQAGLIPNQPALVRRIGRDAQGQAIYEQVSFAELERLSDAYARGLTRYGIGGRARAADGAARPGAARAGLRAVQGRLRASADRPGHGPHKPGRVHRRKRARGAGGHPTRADRAAGAAPGLPHDQAQRHGRRALGLGGARLEQLRDSGLEPFPIADPAPGELAAILFTSGSTGVPKGVAYQHGMFGAQVRALRELYHFAPGEVEMPILPVFASCSTPRWATPRPSPSSTRPGRPSATRT